MVRPSAGVAAAIARRYDVDPVLVRVVFVVGGFYGVGLLLYFVLWVVLPDRTRPGRTPIVPLVIAVFIGFAVLAGLGDGSSWGLLGLLLAGALRSLAGREHDPNLVLDAYLLRALAVAGWAPSFHDCAKCGAPGPHRGFHVVAGGAVCPACRPPGSAAPAPETLLLLSALLAGDWAVADASDPQNRREGSGLTAAFVQWHLERGLRSLAHVPR